MLCKKGVVLSVIVNIIIIVIGLEMRHTILTESLFASENTPVHQIRHV